jgi:hypothetical protein
VKALSGTLEAAQRKPDRSPLAEAKVYANLDQGVRRLAWTRLYSGAEADTPHGMAFDGQGSMHRVRAEGANLYYQKVDSPDEASDYSTWTDLPLGIPAPPGAVEEEYVGFCAIAARGDLVYLFYYYYRKCTYFNPEYYLRRHYSHDCGISWTDTDLASISEAIQSLAACFKDTGENVVCFALTAGLKLDAYVVVAVTQAVTSYQQDLATTPYNLTTTYGLAACWNPTDSVCDLLIAGREDLDEIGSHLYYYGLYAVRMSLAGVFTERRRLLAAETDQETILQYPSCCYPAAPDAYEAPRFTLVENHLVYHTGKRPLLGRLVKDTDFMDCLPADPAYIVDEAGAYGLAICSLPDYWWMSCPSGVWRAPRQPITATDLSADIIEISSDISYSGTRKVALALTLDNSKGQYAAPPPQGSEMTLKLGYRTTAGAELVEAGTFWLDRWEYASEKGSSTITLYCLDAWGQADTWMARYDIRLNGVFDQLYSIAEMMARILARAGIALKDEGYPRSTRLDGHKPQYIIGDGHTGKAELKELLEYIDDALVQREGYMYTRDAVADEAADYAYGTAHAVLAGEYGEARLITHTQAGGNVTGVSYPIRIGAFDWESLAQGIYNSRVIHKVNMVSTAAIDKAQALLAYEQMRSVEAVITVPTNVGQEIYDVVTVTDARCGIENKRYRVLAIQTEFDRRKGRYQQKLHLSAP